jgi:hypothetical protein
MINSARVESDARSAQANEATPRADEFSEHDKQTLGGLESGSEGGYEEDSESPDRVRSSVSSRRSDKKTRKDSGASFGFDYELGGDNS